MPRSRAAKPRGSGVSPIPAGYEEVMSEMLGSEAHESMPALFIGHGSPMNIVADNGYTRDLEALAARLQSVDPESAARIDLRSFTS